MQPLRSHDNVHHAVQQEVRKSTTVCAQLLTDKVHEALTDDAVHEIRTRLKKLRTLLRLIRPDMKESRHRRARRRLQRVSHALAVVRDARVMISTCGKLRLRAGREDRARLRANLKRKLTEAHQQLSPDERRSLSEKLTELQSVIDGWPQSHAGWKCLSPGLQRLYRGGRKALRTARSAPSDTNLHELRKRAKDLLYTCHFLSEASPHAQFLAAELKRFTELLGFDHDLAILHRAASADPLFAQESLRRRLADAAAQRRIALRPTAWKLGARVYEQSTADFMKRMHKDWKHWQER